MTPAEFFDRLEEALFPTLAKDQLPSDWRSYRKQCEDRELAGQDTFGDAYKYRDNAAEGLEEAADGAIYSHLEVERVRCEEGDDEEALQIALMAAQHFYEAHRTLGQLRARVHAVPFSTPDAQPVPDPRPHDPPPGPAGVHRWPSHAERERAAAQREAIKPAS